ncbi:adaptin N terminal region-domain containing protein [Nitzschia inconspicua]|uniref:Adaptin N terminal region-domain containing protein n=1 Tax=Nitzschia inconspicua TaxID=303405 RepID=A0A9K3LQ52_9STRA|nr:adaptin N terminal region-domain containing protein [Nitzschia inconspicua]
MTSLSSAIDTSDPTALLNNQLASALSTLGDAQFWEETISPTTIRNELSSSDPSNPNSTPLLQKGMKWLLASISKGRDVSDFYPHVVKLVGATSLEVRKMVYMYLVQYADHDSTTRELSLLSINSFQRGLADSEQLIRALALRVLSSIRISDILQIQILGVQKCASDTSPYVRKCAANALAKLSPRCDAMQKDMLLQILQEMLNKDTSTMVLTSALIAFCELCPQRLELLHGSYRKICHLLTDMDEWGQVMIIDTMARYCRRFFAEPKTVGTAEAIDQERRVQRKLDGDKITTAAGTTISCSGMTSLHASPDGSSANNISNRNPKSLPNHRGGEAPRKVKRRVVTKGFYSDEEDGSTEEEVYVVPGQSDTLSTASAMRQRNILGLPKTIDGAPNTAFGSINDTTNDDEADLKLLDPDHQLLLTSAMPLLKSRNAGVVLSVCSLLYYCGISSIRSRSAMGKALVRIHRGRREIQYVVLTSIRVLVQDCPSAFAPFLPDFFVKALDPPFTRLIKIDILVSLALEPAAIETVLNELRTYVRHGDKSFACAATRAVGRVTELTRIVYDRHGAKTGRTVEERKTANQIALDALYGLTIITQTSDSKAVVGEAVSAMHNILLMLGTSNVIHHGQSVAVEDPNQVQSLAIRRILILLVNALSRRLESNDVNEDNDDSNGGNEPEISKLSVDLPSSAVSSAVWILGEWLTNSPSLSHSVTTIGANDTLKAKHELVRLVGRSFVRLGPEEKQQAIHFASKLLLSNAVTQKLSANVTPSVSSEILICEHILSMGRVDVNPNVKDRARYESSVLHSSIGLRFDSDGMDDRPEAVNISLESAKKILVSSKPSASYLPIYDETTVDMSSFRFGTLSSLVGHRARGTYLSLPSWSEKNSPSGLREPIEAAKEQLAKNVINPSQPELTGAAGFYADDNDDDSSSSTSSSSTESGGQNADSESDSDSDDESSSDISDDNLLMPTTQQNALAQQNLLFQPILNTQPNPAVPAFHPHMSSQNSSDDESTSSSSDSIESSVSSDANNNIHVSSANVFTSPQPSNPTSLNTNGDLLGVMGSAGFAPIPEVSNNGWSSAMNDLKGLVMAPITVQDPAASQPDPERDSSAWTQLVRPELCGGLSVEIRYLRGTAKKKELQMLNISPSNPCFLCVQVQFKNKRTDSTSIRRIKVLPRSGSSGPHATKKILCPPEISELRTGQVKTLLMILEFASLSNRDGDLIGRIEIKQGSAGGVPVEIKPSLGELLRPPKSTSPEEFDSMISRMQGFQRVESSLTASLETASIEKSIRKCSSLEKVEGKGDKLRFLALLPASDDLVLVQVDVGNGKIVVCCDHAVAINSVLSLIKNAIS